jgi:hypothetical protein
LQVVLLKEPTHNDQEFENGGKEKKKVPKAYVCEATGANVTGSSCVMLFAPAFQPELAWPDEEISLSERGRTRIATVI